MFQIVPLLVLTGKAYDLSVPTTDGTSITLSFLPVPGAKSMEYSISSTSGVSGFGAWTALASDKIITGLSGSTQYWVLVRAVNGLYRGPVSPVRTGTTTSSSALITWTGEDIANHSFASNNYTFTSVPIGTASAGREVIVVISIADDEVVSATIGGITADLRVQTTDSGSGNTAILGANVTTGTVADIVITCVDNIGLIGIQAFAGTGLNRTPTSTGVMNWGFVADPRNIAGGVVPANGFLIWGGGAVVPNATPTWNNLPDNRNEITTSTVFQVLAASSSSASTAARGVTGYNFSGMSAAYAAWAP